MTENITYEEHITFETDWPCIVLVGDLFEGWHPYGPFETRTHADVWIEDQGLNPDSYVVMELEPPDLDEEPPDDD